VTHYNLLAFSARASIPTKAFGQPAALPVQVSAATVHVRATIPADIPDNAVSTIGQVVFTVVQAWAGSRTFNLRRHNANFTNLITWNTRPSMVGTTYSVTVTDPAVGDTFSFDVNADVQGYIAGTLSNYGWELTTTSSSQSLLGGSKASVGVPYLNLEWALPGEPPTDLVTGRIATGNPILTFTLPEDSTHIQVQVSTTDTFASTVYDSGQIAADAAGVFALSGYTIADGATRYWRSRAWAAGVVSEWSGAAELIRDDLATLTITGPGATTGETEPTITWTFSGEAAWQASLYDNTRGVMADDSLRTAGTDLEWTPDHGTHGEATATATVRAWDDKADRVPTPGVPVYAEATHTFDVGGDATDDGPGTQTVTQRGGTPIIDLEWEFDPPLASNQKVQIIRNGRWLKRVAYNATTFADRTAPRFENLTYRVAAVTSAGAVSNVGDTALIYPTSAGVWLLDPDADFADDAAAVILGRDQGEQSMEEQAIAHPVNNRAAVRRRIGLVPPYGKFAGPIMDALGVTADESYEQLMAWKPRDAGEVYRLVYGHQNIPVTIGDVMAFPAADSTAEAAYVGGFSWWQTDDELPW
jgi:hypothetical protein